MRFLRYDWAGAALGIVLPLVATLLAAWNRHGTIGVDALAAVQAGEPLLWLIDTAPFALAVIGWGIERQRRVLAAQQERIAALELQRRISLDRTASELSGAALNLLDDVSSLGAASAQMTASVRGTIETMTALSHGATAVALAAETVAGRALEVASKPGTTTEELATTLRSAAGGAKEIARIAQEQMDGIDRILGAMNQIHFATETSTESAAEIGVEARALAKHARELRRAVAGGDLPESERLDTTDEPVNEPQSEPLRERADAA